MIVTTFLPFNLCLDVTYVQYEGCSLIIDS